DALPDGIYIVDQQYNIQYINPVLKREFGAINNRKCYEYFHDRTESCPWCKNAEVFAGKSVHWEWYSVKNDKYYDLFDTPFVNQDGSISKFEIFHDITERKRAEEGQRKALAEALQATHALRESEEKLRSILESSPDAITVIDTEGKIIECNPALMSMLGYSAKEELIGTNGYDHISPKERERAAENVIKTITEGITRSVEYQILRTDGSELEVEASGSTILDADGNVVSLVIITKDITERKRAEDALRESTAMLKEAQRLAHIGHWYWNVQSDTLTWSEEVFRIFGLDPQTFLVSADTFEQTIHPDDLAPFLQAREQMLAQESDVEIGHRIIRPDGEIRHVMERARVLQNDAGKVMHVMGTVQDVTERKRAEVRYRTVADFTYDWEYWANPDGTLHYVSPACERITGYTVDQFIANPDLIDGLVLPKDVQVWAEHHHTLSEESEAQDVQFRIRRRDGETVWIEHVCQPVVDEQGVFLGQRGSNRDITERKRAEEALQSEKLLSDEYINSLPGLFYVFDEERFIRWNKKWEKVTGYSEEELATK
ncbi:MAG: PAS domain S-box protein, partial [Proteobacteria bacterium]|nr:PAS domain S-box protein [Pseudomonadota bacterium]